MISRNFMILFFFTVLLLVPGGATQDAFAISYVDSFDLPQLGDPSPRGLAFSTDGGTMFVVDTAADSIFQYTLPTPFDVGSIDIATNPVVSFLVEDETTSPRGIAFSDTGKTMFVVGSEIDDQSILQYDLDIPFDLTLPHTVTFVTSFDLSEQTDRPHGITFSTDGKTMFVTERYDSILQYTLPTPFDVGSIDIATNPVIVFSGIGNEINNPYGITFSTDGKTMFVANYDGKSILQYTLTEAFNVDSVVSFYLFDISKQTDHPRGLAFSDDGMTMFVVDKSGDRILQYSPTYPFSFFLPDSCVETIQSITSIISDESITSKFNNLRDVAIDSDGRIIIADTGENRILILESDGTLVESITDADGLPLHHPRGVAIDSDDKIIVSDTGDNNRILIFESDGTFVKSITHDEDGKKLNLNYPYGITIDTTGGRILIADAYNNRIIYLNSDGEYYKTLKGKGGTSFNEPRGVALDSDDRIIIADTGENRVVILSSNGKNTLKIITGVVDGLTISYPVGVAVDSDDRIIITDANNNRILIFESDGTTFVKSITQDNDGKKLFSPHGVTTDSEDRIIVADSGNNRVVIFELEYTCSNPAVLLDDDTEKKGGCADCEPPTFGILRSTNAQIISDGFTYNGQSVDVTAFHTPFPLITVHTNQLNTATVKIYENQGVDNIAMVQFGLGMPEVGSPLSEAQTLVEITLYRTEVENVNVVEKYNLVDVQSVKTSLVDCDPGYSSQCLQVSLSYTYQDQPKYNVMAINAMDGSRNSMTNYLNDGVLVIGESLNDPLLDNTITSNGGAFYPQRAGVVLLTLVDYKTDMWEDSFGYLWTGDSNNSYVLVDNIPPPARTPDVMGDIIKRNHSYFADYKQQQIIIAQKVFDGILFYKEVQGDDLTDYIALTYDFTPTERADDLELQQAIIYEQQRAQKVIDNKVW